MYEYISTGEQTEMGVLNARRKNTSKPIIGIKFLMHKQRRHMLSEREITRKKVAQNIADMYDPEDATQQLQ